MVPHQNRRVQLAAILAAVTLLTGDCFLLRWLYLRYFLVPGIIPIIRLDGAVERERRMIAFIISQTPEKREKGV